MIKITVEVIPVIGGPSRKWHGIIFNDGEGTRLRGDYVAVLLKGGRTTNLMELHQARFQHSAIWRHARVLDFPRKSLGVWHLLARVLKAAGVE